MELRLLVAVGLLVAGTLVGCGSVVDHLQRDLVHGAYAEVVAQGMAHLERSERGEVAPSEDAAVRALVAAAAFRRAEAVGTLAAYGEFEALVASWPEAELLMEALTPLKVEAAFRVARAADTEEAYARYEAQARAWGAEPGQVTRGERLKTEAAFAAAQKVGTVAALRRFRATYPEASEAATALRLEATFRFGEVQDEDTPDGWRGFVETYGDAAIRLDYLSYARARAAELAIEALRAAPTAEGLRAFREAHPGDAYDEALVDVVRRVAFAQAKAENTLEALAGFRTRYGDDPDAAEEIAAIRVLEAAAVEALIASPPDQARCVAWSQTYAEWPEAEGWIHRLLAQCLRMGIDRCLAAGDAECLRETIGRIRHTPQLMEVAVYARDALAKLPPDPVVTRMAHWLGASHLLNDIYMEYMAYLPDRKDSTAQEKKRARDLVRAVKKLKRKLRGDRVRFEALRVVDVEPETALTARGQKLLNRAIREIRRSSPLAADLMLDPDGGLSVFAAFAIVPALMMCKKCVRETGRFVAEYELPVPRGVRVVEFSMDDDATDEGEIFYVYDDYVQTYDDHTGEPEERPPYASYDGFCVLPEDTGWTPRDGLTGVWLPGGYPNEYLDGAPLATVDVKITRTIRSKRKALALVKGSVIPVEGKIANFSLDSQRVHLELR